MKNNISLGACCQQNLGDDAQQNSGDDAQQNLGNDAQQNLGDDAQQMGTIYKITNLVNGKIYVGQTRQKLEKRINQHKRNSKTAKFGIDAAIRKHGWENFKVEILEICPIDKLNEREIFWIDELDSMVPKNYNLTKGGNNKSIFSEETRARMSAAKKGKTAHNKGKKMSEEQKLKVSKNHADVSGEKNAFYGKHHTKEARAKMSAAKKGKPHKPHSPETRAQISASNKGKHSYNKGKPLSKEHKAKISAAQKAYWARRKALAKDGDS